ncbi:MAG TPA: hypothetical protein VGG55_05375 [Candidatus Acidoferrales bacterium]
MSHRQPDHLERRDIALARVLAEALKQRQTTGTSAEAPGEACPEAELLGAYAERALGAQEIARWENHFAACSRCRTVLAVLTASAEDPLTAQEVRQLGKVVATAELPGARAQQQPRPSRPASARWPWLVPALGLAAAMAVFFVLHPLGSGPAAPRLGKNQLAVKTLESPSGAAPNKKAPGQAPNGQAEKQADRQIAESYIPAPPTSGERTNAPNREAATSARDFLDRRDRAESKDKKEAGEPTPPPSQQQPSAAAAASDDRALQSEAAPVNGPAVDAASRAATPVAPRPFAPAAEAKSAGPVALAEQSATAKGSLKQLGFSSPGAKVLWRFGVSGRIARSVDQGRNWQSQSSGVDSDLLGGVATSEQVAWVVGRNGVILRTTDGSHWQRVASPEVAPLSANANPTSNAAGSAAPGTTSSAAPDWISVQATDALHATVLSRDGQRFRTEDGGRTWTRQP